MVRHSFKSAQTAQIASFGLTDPVVYRSQRLQVVGPQQDVGHDRPAR
jgi:hypothetical protein